MNIFKFFLFFNLFLFAFAISNNSFAKDVKKTSIKKSSYNIEDEYSFEDIFNKNGKHLKRRFAVSLNYDTRFFNDFASNGSSYQYGWGMALEFFPANRWFSIYASFGDNYKNSKLLGIETKAHSDTIYLGSRIYFAFLYLGAGGAILANNTISVSGHKTTNIVELTYYVQVGGNFALAPHTSLDTGVNIQTTTNNVIGNFYIGVKYSV